MKKLDFRVLSLNIEGAAQYDFLKNKLFGSAYCVYQDGSTVFKKCFGTVSLNGNAPVTEDTLFRLASMTKPITAFATLMLVDRGLLSLDDTADEFLPDFKSVTVNGRSGECFKPHRMPTVRNILSHTSGIAGNCDRLADMTAEDKATLDSSIRYYIKTGLDYDPGTAQMYSGTGSFDVLVKIIEAVTKTDYPSFLKKEIFEPCKMTSTVFSPSAEQAQRIIKMHQRVDGENAEFEMPDGCIFEDYPYSHYLGGAGLVSSLSDYCKFAEMLLFKGKTGSLRLIGENTFAELCTPQVSKEIMPGRERWGLGVRVITEDSYPYLPKGSFGWSGAYGSHFWVDPENRIFAVYMKNSKFDGGSANESARNFEKAVYTSLR